MLAMALLGFGTALAYPTLLAAISDVAHPQWRASAVGVVPLVARRWLRQLEHSWQVALPTLSESPGPWLPSPH